MKTMRRIMPVLLVAWIILGMIGCIKKGAEMVIQKNVFGKLADGTAVDLYTLSNANGVQVGIINWGSTLVSAKVPDKNGRFEDVVVGFDSMKDFLENKPYAGCIVGRFSNRIANGQFSLGKKVIKLALNSGSNHIHGVFPRVLWTAKEIHGQDSVGLELSYFSPDGEDNYPGNMTVTVAYTLNNRNELRLDYSAVTDKETVVNLTNHAYFNMGGEGSGDVLGHELQILADRFLPVNQNIIPTGELRNVSGTPFDFTQPHRIGERIGQPEEQLVLGKGYDHCFVINKKEGELAHAARAVEPNSGRVLDVYTTEPGVQLYTGNYLGGIIGKGGKSYPDRSGFCLETQHFPDSPNQPSFPSTTLKPGGKYTQTTVFKFSVK